jgi:hypothetical protein
MCARSPWVARCIGKGNHVTFVSMLICGETAMVAWSCSLYNALPPSPHASWSHALSGDDEAATHARLALSGVPFMFFLHMMLTPLLFAHIYLAACNVTTKEHFRHSQNAKHGTPAMPGSKGWKRYAPYDRGICANLAGFVSGTRDEVDGGTGGTPSSREASRYDGESGHEREHDDSHELLEVCVDEPSTPSDPGRRRQTHSRSQSSSCSL